MNPKELSKEIEPILVEDLNGYIYLKEKIYFGSIDADLI